MDIRQIRYALTVAKERSFTNAATRLNISQSAVSEQVKLLEERVGFQLFRRNGRGVEPTEHGRTFLAQAERVASDLLSLMDVARRLRGLGGETLRVGIGSGLAGAVLPRLFGGEPHSGDVLIEIRTAPTRVIFDELHAERLDLGIVVDVTPDRVPSGLSVVRLLEVEMVAIAPLGTELPLVHGRVDLARLGDTPMILNELSVGYGQIVNSLLSDLGVRPRIVALVDNVETIKVMVRAGVATALVPASSTEDEARFGLMQVHPVTPACRALINIYTSGHRLSGRKADLIEPLLGRTREAV
jgi:DNA-binding transcriptional LysR family regulator